MTRRHHTLLLLALAGLLLFASCAAVKAEGRRGGGAEVRSPLLPRSSAQFGISYAQCESTLKCELAGTYAQLGASRVKIANIQWGHIEPDPPADGRHDYRWWSLDHLVSNWQAAGYEVWILLRARSDWAGVEPYDRLYTLLTTTMPQDEYLDDYQDWVRAVMERYDHDGVDDMDTLGHQLLAPVRYYEFESEAQIPAQWQGRSQATRIADYLELLGLARQAARDAYPDVQIVLAGVGTTDIFDDFPTDEEIEQRIAALDPEPEQMFREAVAFTQQTLAAVDLYDVVEFHANSNYTGLYGAVDWIREMMPVSRPIWAGDASSAPMLVEASDWDFNPPYPGQTGEQLYQRIKNGDAEAVAWLRKEQAELTAKKLVVGMELGLGLVSLGNLTDWPEYFSGKNWAYHGLVDGGVWDYDPDVHQPRPAFYTYRLLVEKLAGATAVQRLDLGPGVYAYRVTLGGRRPPLHAQERTMLLLWYDDYVYQQPGQAEGSVTVQLSVSSPVATVTHIITAIGQTQPTVEAVPAAGSQVTLTVTETPIFVEEVSPRGQSYLPLVQEEDGGGLD